MTTRDLTAVLLGAWLGAAAMWAFGLAVWPDAHPGRTWVTLPRPDARVGGELGAGDLIPAQQLPTTPGGE